MNETVYGKLLPQYGELILMFTFMIWDSFVLGVKTKSNIGKMKQLGDLLDFDNSDPKHKNILHNKKSFLLDI